MIQRGVVLQNYPFCVTITAQKLPKTSTGVRDVSEDMNTEQPKSGQPSDAQNKNEEAPAQSQRPETEQVSYDDEPQSRPRQTEMLSQPEGLMPMPDRAPQPGTAMLEAGWRLIFRIGDQKQSLTIQDRILIGRALENDDNNEIDFDLTPFGAYHFGVSRQHAAMTLKDGYLYMEDLGSTNGTRINGFQLTAHQKYRLRDGDEIEFARLRTSIRFRSPS